MALSPDATYFPPLEKCLAGDERLISWKTAYRSLEDFQTAGDIGALEAFLSNPQSEKLLANAFEPFPPPDQVSKTEFEAKTAPINISESTSGKYDLSEIKKDALWLSQKVNVGELVALRVAILEWQQRAEEQLLNGSEHGSEPSEADMRMSIFGKSAAGSGQSEDGSATRNDENSRHNRQLRIFLEEKRFIVEVLVVLLGTQCVDEVTVLSGGSWIGELAARITNALCPRSNKVAHEKFIQRGIDAVRQRLRSLDDDSLRPEIFKQGGLVRDLHSVSLVFEAIAALRLLIASVHSYPEIVDASIVQAWYELANTYAFFHELQQSPTVPEPAVIQCLFASISLQILQLKENAARIQDIAEVMVEGSLYPTLKDHTWTGSDACLKQVNLALCQAAQIGVALAGPAMYAFGLITAIIRDMARMQQELRDQGRLEDASVDAETSARRRSSVRDPSSDQSFYEIKYGILQDYELEPEIRDDPPAYVTRVAVDQLQVYSTIGSVSSTTAILYGLESDASTSYIIRANFLDLIRQSMPFIAYDVEVLEAIFTTISPNIPGSTVAFEQALANKFASDTEVFQSQVVAQALARYPFELSPLLRIFKVLSRAKSADTAGPATAVKVLESLQSMTIMAHEHFNDYTLDHEDENINSMVLTNTLPLFATREAYSLYASKINFSNSLASSGIVRTDATVLEIPAGSSGAIVRETRPMVFRLEHDHSALEYFGLLLSTTAPSSEIVPIHQCCDSGFDVAAEIIMLITDLLASSLKQSQGIEGAQFVLDRLGYVLPVEQDIVSVITDLFEMVLFSYLDQSAQEGSLDILVACAEFLDQLVAIAPERVWSALAQSSLLGLSGASNAMATVVGAAEVSSGQFNFLLACTKIYSHLLDNAVASSARRRESTTKAQSRFASVPNSVDVTPENIMKTVLDAYHIVMLDVWHTMSEWRFHSSSQRSEVSTLILEAFNTLILSYYGISMGQQERSSLSMVIGSSARSLLETFAPEVGKSIPLGQFSSVLAVGVVSADNLASAHERVQSITLTRAALACLTTIIRTVRTNVQTRSRSISVGSQLLQNMPHLAKLMVVDHSIKAPICFLLTELLYAISETGSGDPPSVLGQLRPSVAKSFLAVLAHLDQPLKDLSTECSIWRFLSTIMVSKQQWFATYLLTGALPKERLKDTKTQSNVADSRSLLTYALDQLSENMAMEPERSTAMLRFIASAQNAWVWATVLVRSHPSFTTKALAWVNELQRRASNPSQELIIANEHEMAALLCDIFAVNLQASSESKDKSLLKVLVPSLAFFREHAVRVDAYNRSLHRRLADNFNARFPQYSVAMFTRTEANPAGYGQEYIYDLIFATKLLEHDPAWYGTTSGRSRGFMDEFTRANINLSLVAAQTRLLQSWNILCTTLCENAEHLHPLRVELAETAVRCLDTNADANLDQPNMDVVVRVRANMAFTIISTLVAVKAAVAPMQNLLLAAWSLVRNSPADYDVATSVEDVQYYRLLLRTLYLSLQPHIYMEPAAQTANEDQNPGAIVKAGVRESSIYACLIDIVTRAIAPGFRALCGNLHGNINLATPSDFALLTALLQAVLSARDAVAVYPQIADVIASSSLVRGALSLFSWSDQLAEAMEDDPIYGEFAIKFLLELSTVQQIAEQIALDGALAQISSANLTNYFRKVGGKSPFDEPQRMFRIWTEGILPLCLNLLDAVGPPIAAEVATFLNSFPAQLGRAQVALENREPSSLRSHAGAVTLGLVSEAHSLCLIARILSSDMARGAADGIDAADVPRLELDHVKLKDDASALLRQKSSLAARIIPVGATEAEWNNRDTGNGGNLLQQKITRELSSLLDCFEDELKAGSPGVAFAL